MKAAIKAVAESLPVLVIHGDVSTTKLWVSLQRNTVYPWCFGFEFQGSRFKVQGLAK